MAGFNTLTSRLPQSAPMQQQAQKDLNATRFGTAANATVTTDPRFNRGGVTSTGQTMQPVQQPQVQKQMAMPVNALTSIPQTATPTTAPAAPATPSIFNGTPSLMNPYGFTQKQVDDWNRSKFGFSPEQIQGWNQAVGNASNIPAYGQTVTPEQQKAFYESGLNQNNQALYGSTLTPEKFTGWQNAVKSYNASNPLEDSTFSKGMGWVLGRSMNEMVAKQIDRTVGNNDFSTIAPQVVKGGMRLAGGFSPILGAMGEFAIESQDNPQSSFGGALGKGAANYATNVAGGAMGGLMGGANAGLTNTLGGGVTGTALSGATTGAIGGGLMGGLTSGLTGGNIGEGITSGARAGAISGGAKGFGTGLDKALESRPGGVMPTVGNLATNAIRSGAGYLQGQSGENALLNMGLSTLNPALQQYSGGLINAGTIAPLARNLLGTNQQSAPVRPPVNTLAARPQLTQQQLSAYVAQNAPKGLSMDQLKAWLRANPPR